MVTYQFNYNVVTCLAANLDDRSRELLCDMLLYVGIFTTRPNLMSTGFVKKLLEADCKDQVPPTQVRF